MVVTFEYILMQELLLTQLRTIDTYYVSLQTTISLQTSKAGKLARVADNRPSTQS